MWRSMLRMTSLSPTPTITGYRFLIKKDGLSFSLASVERETGSCSILTELPLLNRRVGSVRFDILAAYQIYFCLLWVHFCILDTIY